MDPKAKLREAIRGLEQGNLQKAPTTSVGTVEVENDQVCAD